MTFLVVWAMTENLGGASLILIIGGSLLGCKSYRAFAAIFNHMTRRRRAVMRKIEVTTNLNEAEALLEEAFELFDEVCASSR